MLQPSMTLKLGAVWLSFSTRVTENDCKSAQRRTADSDLTPEQVARRAERDRKRGLRREKMVLVEQLLAETSFDGHVAICPRDANMR